MPWIDDNKSDWDDKELDVKWWEMLEWEEMKLTWTKLPESLKQEIRDAGLAPSYDTLRPTVIKEEK